MCGVFVEGVLFCPDCTQPDARLPKLPKLLLPARPLQKVPDSPSLTSQVTLKVEMAERKSRTYRKCKETSAKAPEARTALVAVVCCPRRAEASRYTLSVLLRGDEISGALSLSCRRCGILRLSLRCVRELWRVRCGGSGGGDGATRGGARRGKAVRWEAGGAKGLSRGCC